MMLIHELSSESHKLLLFLKDSPMKPEEKIAALKSAASVIENALSAEMLKATYVNILLRSKGNNP